MRFVMNTGRTITQGRHIESKGGRTYSEETGTCFMHPFDMMGLGIDDRDRVAVTSEWGTIVLTVRESEDLHEGEVFVPYGPFANHITHPDTHSSGMPDYKYVNVEIEPTDLPQKIAWELMEEMGGLRYENR